MDSMKALAATSCKEFPAPVDRSATARAPHDGPSLRTLRMGVYAEDQSLDSASVSVCQQWHSSRSDAAGNDGPGDTDSVDVAPHHQ